MSDVAQRWDGLMAALVARDYPRELIDQLVAVVAADAAGANAEAARLLDALRVRAEQLAPHSIGPPHHDVSRALAALEAVCVELGPVLALVRRMWSPPVRR